MKIVPIFVQENKQEGLFSIQFPDEEEDELTKCMGLWYDTSYLYDFFNKHDTDLNSGFYDKHISLPEAIKETRLEADLLFENLKSLAISGTTQDGESLGTVFEPLKMGISSHKELQKEKAKSYKNRKWLRVYAIRISNNTYIVTGGAIKLVNSMNERAHLKYELEKLTNVERFLREEGIIDQDDFELLEF